MASLEFIQKRIAGKEKEIAKLEAKLSRIEKAEATGWTVNPYYYSESDKRWAVKDLENARAALRDYQDQLAEEQTKAASRNVPAILEFLEQWKARCTAYYGNMINEIFAEQEAVRELYRAYSSCRYGTEEYKTGEERYKARHKSYREKLHGYYETQTCERYGRTREYEVKVRDGEWEPANPYLSSSVEESMAKLKKDLDQEAIRKYDFIIERTCAIVGEITDASDLHVGAKGDLNGYIVGTTGTAKVQTIGAGGYNIQCFHFRTLIHSAQ